MQLKYLLEYKPIDIEYRTYDMFGDDILAGYCKWTGTELVALDGDNYSVEDEVYKYRRNTPRDLTVWYESKWI